MRLVYFLPAFVSLATAQNLMSALGSNDNLSTLSSLISTDSELLRTVESVDNVTILAPTNKAIEDFEEGNSARLRDGRLTQALMQYHVLNGRYPFDSIRETGIFIPTLLTDDAHVNVSGGQVVQAVRTSSHSQNASKISEDKVEFYSGYNSKSTLVDPDIGFDGGLIHTIDSMLVIPRNVTETSLAAGLTSLVGAVRVAEFQWNEWRNATYFAPNNEAFRAVSSVLANMTKEELHTTLMYHVINDTLPIYTTRISHADWITTTGTNITFTWQVTAPYMSIPLLLSDLTY
ncbi:hypothetical protein N7532_001991 [Penicillium argentinense]|uniref:FAS1 domain-containing protein n=1 Tax=Penicillium argentinense TaxID=1131581 RepID=A0A9W9G3R9_9EURO|nr:uncharacterized protein N7532_001991 [Penicillium argentinense]KAJ5111456.1 hypothetical protein N7532_001991 [Penicillium argentinense]